MSTATPSSSQNIAARVKTRYKLWWPLSFFISILLPVAIAVILYQLDTFDPAPHPEHELTQKKPFFVSRSYSHMLHDSEKIGVGLLLAPEDIAYNPQTGVIYTGCEDGWINRFKLNESVSHSVPEKWIYTGGRPLGIAHGQHGEVIVADAYKGLLNVSASGVVEVLTDEAEGIKFKLTDAVDIAHDGVLYFTDASCKYDFKQYIWDFLEGRPYGRFMSHNPLTKQTKVLVRDLYFANGVAVSPDQKFVIFCETPMRRCKRYYIQGERKGSVDVFIDNLPGLPDNIRYDGEGHYWIALSMGSTRAWELVQRYPFIRKITAILEKYKMRPHFEKNGGVLSVDLEGKPIEHYYDSNLSLISSGIKIGEYLYCGSIVNPYVMRLNTCQYGAVSEK